MTKPMISILGSGWLGMPLANTLKKDGHFIKLSTRNKARLAELDKLNVATFIVDLERDDNDLDSFLNADILIINITSKQLKQFESLIPKIEGSTIENVLFISSTSVYPSLNKVITEDENQEDPLHPLSKIEQLFRKNTYFKTTILRFSGLIGYQRHPGRFFRSGKTVSDPNAPVNLIHRDDCIGIILAIIQQQVWGVDFNACTDTHPTKRQFYSHSRALLNLPPPPFADIEKSDYKQISNAKIKRDLAYRFIHSDLMKIAF